MNDPVNAASAAQDPALDKVLAACKEKLPCDRLGGVDAFTTTVAA
ncbi:hypothetical protein [Streptomyces camelliae]|uniref:Transposase n=1 Tax=Streptomyces camelliae TaxID=3004093 RepID=A0ABY7PGK9_9ACTN|nr:hypothetical protein [Streptomyces sp. HUAS 2-6]WBO68999.1 hypothetical protein O1G22_42660 [Streptomyces sp. HUAS 2-6]